MKRLLGAVPFAVSAAYAAKSEQFEAKKVSLPSANAAAIQLDPDADLALRVGSKEAPRNASVHGELWSNKLSTGEIEAFNDEEPGRRVFRLNGAAPADGTLVEIGNSDWNNRNLRVHGEVQARLYKGAFSEEIKTCDGAWQCSCNNGWTIISGGVDCNDASYRFVQANFPNGSNEWRGACTNTVSSIQPAGRIRIRCLKKP